MDGRDVNRGNSVEYLAQRLVDFMGCGSVSISFSLIIVYFDDGVERY